MCKRIAVICMLAILVGLFTLAAPQSSAAAGTYQVGYARVDINPYVEEDDLSSGIMALPLRGVGDVWNRLSKKQLLDDNGDGVDLCVVNENLGIWIDGPLRISAMPPLLPCRIRQKPP